ncbi:proteasome subunit alpha type-7-1-like [Cydia fagiglandana]|uniref:proteasome subunit alpha type-7-1-like n=1 Tax=Cydia fagiglandana TaxID=1458189 RepID=UPI002FEE0B9D
MSRYDRAVTVFSPDGQLLQVQYAQEAVKRGFAAVGIRGPNVVVLAGEKRALAKLQEDRMEKKIYPLDEHVVLVFSGWAADARVMVSRAQIECQSFRLMVEDLVTVEYIARYIAGLKQKYTQGNGRRPFGISCIIGGFDCDGTPHLFQTNPSGTYYEWQACAAGRCDGAVLEFLEKNYSPQAVATDAGTIKLAIRALLEVVQGRDHRKLEVAVLQRGKPIKMLDLHAIGAIIAEIGKDKEEEKELKLKK